MTKIYVQLQSSTFPSGVLDCLCITNAGEVSANKLKPEQIAKKGNEIVGVVPMQMISWHELDLPAGLKLQGNQRLARVLSEIIEDNQLDEPERMHCALAPNAQPGSLVRTAVVEKDWLAECIERLEDAGITLARIVPEICPDAMEAGDVFVVSKGHIFWASMSDNGIIVTLPLSEELSYLISKDRKIFADSLSHSVTEVTFGHGKVGLLTDTQHAQMLDACCWDLAQNELRGCGLRAECTSQ